MLSYIWATTSGQARGPGLIWIMRELKIGCKSTMVDWTQFFRDVCFDYFLQNPVQIGGPGTIVEIDESLFARRKYNRGRWVVQKWVFGGWDRDAKVGFLVYVQNRSANTLIPIIQQYILPGTTIYSDCWPAYNQLNELGYDHRVVNHSRNFVDPQTGVCTNGIEGMWSRAKSKFKAMNGTSRVLIAEYLSEFMWTQRFPGNKFANLWKCITEMERYRFEVTPADSNHLDDTFEEIEFEEVGNQDILPEDI